MQLAHTCDNGLSCIAVGMLTEGRILLCKLCKCRTKLVLTSLCLGLDSKLYNRLWEFHRFKNNRVSFITNGITCGCILEADGCSNVARVNLFKLHSLIGVHLQDTSDTLFLILCCIKHIRTGICSSRIYTEIRKLSYKGIRHDLECKSRKGLLVRCMSYGFISVKVYTVNRRNVHR